MSLLISESPLSFSAQLAETIGLEEAIVLQLLHQVASFQEGPEFTVASQKLAKRLSFWSLADIQRILKSLADKGVIEPYSAPITQTEQWVFSFDGQYASAPSEPAVKPIVAVGANKISPLWQPDNTVIQQLAQHGIDEAFVYSQLAEFVRYWQDRNEVSHSWGARFYKHVVRQWQYQQNQPWLVNKEAAQPLQSFWQPSNDAIEILLRNGIKKAFIEDAVAEFVLYWQEKGTATNTWNSKFIQHVKRQWARYTASLQYDTEPRRIAANWQPSPAVFDILKMANIDANFAKERLQEFVLYWKDSNQMHASWNTKFLQHIKYCWANQYLGATYARQQTLTGQAATATSFIDRHTDRSWAD